MKNEKNLTQKRPSLAKAVAAEVFEEAAQLAGAELNFESGREINHLSSSDLERLRELAGCVHRDEDDIENCDANFCFHQKWRSHNG